MGMMVGTASGCKRGHTCTYGTVCMRKAASVSRLEGEAARRRCRANKSASGQEDPPRSKGNTPPRLRAPRLVMAGNTASSSLTNREHPESCSEVRQLGRAAKKPLGRLCPAKFSADRAGKRDLRALGLSASCFDRNRGHSTMTLLANLGRASCRFSFSTHCHCLFAAGLLLPLGHAEGLRCCRWCFRVKRHEEHTLHNVAYV
mmetsp:Transcript_24036/g.62173  ORF Transcript_24036/g.62173 Transcript_24036/m.62173 type:complete len:202 (-) Transcript_24036:156-761(-)